jgi:hypothetical protein
VEVSFFRILITFSHLYEREGVAGRLKEFYTDME